MKRKNTTPAQTGPTRAVVYCRVSTQEQTKGYSLAVQRDAGLELCQRRGWVVAKVCEDAGVSGTKLETRKGMTDALETIERGEASALVATKIDRIGRSTKTVLDIVERACVAGATVCTADGNEYSNHGNGALMLTMLAAIAQMEHEQIKERCTSGREAAAAKGLQPSRHWSPFGYRIVTKADVMAGHYQQEQLGQYVLRPEEAACILRAGTLYAEGHSLRSLCKALTSEGVKARNGGEWQPGTLGRLLRHPVYAGRAQWTPSDEEEPITIPCPRVFSDDLHAAILRRFATRQGIGGVREHKYPLSGLMRCPDCGRRMSGTRATRKTCVGYLCTSARRMAPTNPCEHRQRYAQTAILAAVKSVVGWLLTHPDALSVSALSWQKAKQAKADDRATIRQVEKEIDAADRAVRAAVQGQIAGVAAGAPVDLYLDTIRAESERANLLRARLASITSEKSGADLTRSIAAFAASLPAFPIDKVENEAIPGAERSRLVSMLFDRITPERTQSGRIAVRLESDFGEGVKLVAYCRPCEQSRDSLHRFRVRIAIEDDHTPGKETP